jgi:DNA-directed RNA polymerase subunit E'/Rpb7
MQPKTNPQNMARFDSVLLVPTILRERILLHPRDFDSNYRETLLKNLKQTVEGICSRNGYVMRGSVELREILAGRIEPNSMNGDTVFSVKYHAYVCNPPTGLIVKALVTDSNAFAVFARSGIMDDDGEFTPLLDVILTRAQHETDDRLSTLENGNEIYVEILGKRFELGDMRISVVAQLRDEDAYTTQSKSILNLKEEPLAFVKDVDGMTPIAEGLRFDDETHIHTRTNTNIIHEDEDDDHVDDIDGDDDNEDDVDGDDNEDDIDGDEISESDRESDQEDQSDDAISNGDNDDDVEDDDDVDDDDEDSKKRVQ